MRDTRVLEFVPFRLDLGAERLWRGAQVVRLTAKAFAVLRHLVSHAGNLVTRDELREAVWALPVVSEAAIAVCVGEIRRALRDSAQTPQFLETVRGRGYRFCAPVTVVGPSPWLSARETLTPAALPRPVPLVGREAELAQVHQWWAQARQGSRQVVFVTGEAGIGKTTLVDAFVAQVAPTEPVWIGWGQCVEQHGAGEPYLPLLEALGRLGRGSEGSQVVAVLRQQAPSWLLQLPALVPEDAYEALQRRGGGGTRERMLRELAEAVEALAATRPVVLVVEDLHWSDAATVDWLAYVARRREAARLLVLGTYRPTDALVQGHPVHTVAQALQLHAQGRALSLGHLPKAAVAAYLAQRFGRQNLPAALVRALHRRTTGNPLFLVTVVEALVRQGQLREGGEDLAGPLGDIPDSLRQLMEQQLSQCSPADQALLEAASVAGREFAVAAVAAALAQAVDEVEARCEALARQGQFLQACGTDIWPDGTATERYGFLHDLYRETLYARVPMGRRVRWHRQIGRRLEAGYGVRARERAAELAEHFGRGRDPERAVPYLRYAGEQAVQRSAHQEALVHLTKGLELLPMLPETPVRAQQELDLQLALGAALMAIRGYGAPEVGETYRRARALCKIEGDTQQSFQALWGLWRFHVVGQEVARACPLADELLALAPQTGDAVHLVAAHNARGITSFYLGEFSQALAHFESAATLYDPQGHPALAFRYGQDPGVICHAFAALTLWMLGYPAKAMHRSQEAFTLAHDPFSLAYALFWTALPLQCCRHSHIVQDRAEAAIALSKEQGFAIWLAGGMVLQGWARAQHGQVEEGLAQMKSGIGHWRATGAKRPLPYLLSLLGEAYMTRGQVTAALDLLAEALSEVETYGERWWEAELHRLRGELLLAHLPRQEAEAETCFLRAIDIASHQRAKSLELRAAMSLGHLWQTQEQHERTRALLAPLYAWFTERQEAVDPEFAP